MLACIHCKQKKLKVRGALVQAFAWMQKLLTGRSVTPRVPNATTAYEQVVVCLI